MFGECAGSPLAEYRPLTPERWDDFEALFGPHGADGGCWCMWWRLTRAQFHKQKGERNRLAMRQIVASGEIPGIVGYRDGKAIAWCAVAPRERLPALDHSRLLKRVDGLPVWSLACFFVAESVRRRGVMAPLVSAAVSFASGHGAKIVEGYPIEAQGALKGSAGYTGIASAFRAAGFVDVARRGERLVIVRRYL